MNPGGYSGSTEMISQFHPPSASLGINHGPGRRSSSLLIALCERRTPLIISPRERKRSMHHLGTLHWLQSGGMGPAPARASAHAVGTDSLGVLAHQECGRCLSVLYASAVGPVSANRAVHNPLILLTVRMWRWFKGR